MHPAEAVHGDLGMVEKRDVVILMSYSGESEEVVRLLPILQEIGCATVAITGKPKSTLARETMHHFFFPEFEEACYMHLAPTSSTTALLVLGDALALVVSRAKNYTKENFGRNHPAGALGRKLLVKVSDLMHTGSGNAVVREGSSLRSAIVEMSAKGLSMVTIVDGAGQLKGIITDGDLRRHMGPFILESTAADLMTHDPICIEPEALSAKAEGIMEQRKITCMFVVDEERRPLGVLSRHDL